MRRGADALETINAAATVIASAENRVSQASSIQKRRWGSCWSLYWCFGSQNNKKRIGHAVLVPETTIIGPDGHTAERPFQPPSIVLPFVAPPSSPASFFPSEPPSASQSPTGLLSLSSVSANMYSPSGPASIFAIGPYAYETQLVSPPVFSTFTTEPSTAPYTPPPESIHLTTPSSPEVPFARLLEPNLQNREPGQRYPFSPYEFQSYQLQPGSPVSHLISPSSGTSSPFPDPEFTAGHPFFLEFRTGNPPKILDLDKIMLLREWESRQGSGAVTPDAVGPRSCDSGLLTRQHSDVVPLPDTCSGIRKDDTVVDHRVSFEITAEKIIRCVEMKPVTSPRAVPERVEKVEITREENPMLQENVNDCRAKEISVDDASENTVANGENEQRHQKNRTITLGSTKEFNFNNIDEENSDEPGIGSDWWANKKVSEEEAGGPRQNWPFFPMVQTGVS